MEENTNTRRDFLKKVALGTAGLSLGALGFPASSYARIMGANDRVNFAIAGINSRGKALIKSSMAAPNTSIGYLCDVDSRVFEEGNKLVQEAGGKKPRAQEDFRRLMERKDLDAVAIATPEHWHAPMAIMAAQAGKHVYVEKPCSHNPYEGELLIEVQKKTGKLIQMGNQQRSAPTSIQAIKDIREGIIGTPYFGKAWYANNRGSIGRGKKVPVPAWLNWELWQGPAPRRDYPENVVHYHWHWFWDWGTGEIHNNGTHEIDICRWALGVELPERVNSAGGRFHFEDDWEFYDTQVVSYEFPENKMITWEGKSCNNFTYYDRGRGATIHGTEGTVLLDRNIYQVFDQKGGLLKEMKESDSSATTNTVGEGALDVYHMANFVESIRGKETLNAPIDEAAVSTLLCHYGNISQKVGRTLNIDQKTGHILQDAEAMKLWRRDYAPGWEPKV
jgi:predicted dehydrogenase